MNIILAFLLAIPCALAVGGNHDTAGTGDKRQCISGAARMDFADGTPESFEARGRIRQCPTPDFGCGIVRKFGSSRQLNENEEVDPNTQTRGYKTVNMGCVPPAVCEKIVGGTDGSGCAYTDYIWNRFEPQSCNATDAPITYRQTVRLVYGCCNGDDCYTQTQANDATVTRDTIENTCTHNTKLGEYVEELHKCWNTGRATFREFFRCDATGMDLVDFREVCRDDVYGEYDRSLAASSRGTAGENCRWRPTCSEDLQNLIQSFGECACTAAEDKDFTGAAIGALMESYWNEFCPQIEISCAGENMGLFLRRRRRRRRIKFRVARAKSYIEGKMADWKTRIADYLRIRAEDAEGTIEITVDDSESGRRLLEDSSTVNIDVFTDDAMNDEIDTDACSQSGLATTLDEAALEKISCEYEDVEEALFGSATTTPAPSDDNSGAQDVHFWVAFGVVIGILGFVFE